MSRQLRFLQLIAFVALVQAQLDCHHGAGPSSIIVLIWTVHGKLISIVAFIASVGCSTISLIFCFYALFCSRAAVVSAGALHGDACNTEAMDSVNHAGRLTIAKRHRDVTCQGLTINISKLCNVKDDVKDDSTKLRSSLTLLLSLLYKSGSLLWALLPKSDTLTVQFFFQ